MTVSAARPQLAQVDPVNSTVCLQAHEQSAYRTRMPSGGGCAHLLPFQSIWQYGTTGSVKMQHTMTFQVSTLCAAVRGMCVSPRGGTHVSDMPTHMQTVLGAHAAA